MEVFAAVGFILFMYVKFACFELGIYGIGEVRGEEEFFGGDVFDAQ